MIVVLIVVCALLLGALLALALGRAAGKADGQAATYTAADYERELVITQDFWGRGEMGRLQDELEGRPVPFDHECESA